MTSGRTEYVVLSDVHLNEIVEPAHEGWWDYKREGAKQDGDLASFLEAIVGRRPAPFEATELIFNGDTFDFDLVYGGPEGMKVPRHGMPSSVRGSVFKMRTILADHPVFVAAMGRFLAAGNRVVFAMGNHDRELCFPEVQEVLRQAIVDVSPAGHGVAVAEAIRFEPWFVYRAGVLFVEHGQQYDATCSYRDVLDPVVKADRAHAEEVETPFGSLLGRQVLCRLGTFNPYNDESFILSLGGYAKHAWRHYIPKRRPFLRSYLFAVWLSLRELLGRRRRALAQVRTDHRERHLAHGAAAGVSETVVDLLLRLSSAPISDRLGRLMHELWLDRLLFMGGALALLIVGMTLVTTVGQGLALLALVPLILFVLRAMGRGSLALQERARWGLVAEEIAQALDVPVVAFGHSHRPERRPLIHGGRYYNLGSWAPVVESDRGSSLWRARRYLIVRPRAAGQVYTVFARWETTLASDSVASSGTVSGDGEGGLGTVDPTGG